MVRKYVRRIGDLGPTICARFQFSITAVSQPFSQRTPPVNSILPDPLSVLLQSVFGGGGGGGRRLSRYHYGQFEIEVADRAPAVYSSDDDVRLGALIRVCGVCVTKTVFVLSR